MSAAEEIRQKYAALVAEWGEIGGHISALEVRRREIGGALVHLSEAAKLFGEDLALPFVPSLARQGNSSRATVRDFVLTALRAAPEGMRASELNEQYQKACGSALHPKTIGMTLFRLKKDGLSYREGSRIWFASSTPGDQPGRPLMRT